MRQVIDGTLGENPNERCDLGGILIVSWGAGSGDVAVLELVAPSSSELKLSPEKFRKAVGEMDQKDRWTTYEGDTTHPFSP